MLLTLRCNNDVNISNIYYMWSYKHLQFFFIPVQVHVLLFIHGIDIYVTEYGTALTTILPIFFLYLNTVTVTAGTFEP